MKYRFILALFLCIFLLGHSFILAQAPEAPVAPAEEKKAITPPNTMEEAKALFIEAWNMEHEQQFDDAIARYNTVIAYFQKLETREGNIYVMHVMNNVGGILASQGKYRESINLFKGALDLAVKLDDYANLSEFHHKLGILYNQVYNAQVESEKMKNVVYPAGQKFELSDKVLFTKGSYTRFSQIDNELIANRIQMRGSQNPFEIENDLYSKLVNLKVRSDFEPDKLLTPDSVKFIIQIEKKGYFNVSKLKDLLPSMEYAEINETMQAIPRGVTAKITEDFYNQGQVNPDEITLTSVDTTNTMGKPITITDKETFRPGTYQLNIKKRGYTPVVETLIIYPGEGNFTLERKLKSSLRNLNYRIQGDFTATGTGLITPDEISLNSQPINNESRVKPSEYKLVVTKEGYEPIIRNVIIEPDERVYFITEYMKSLPREVIFQVSGDYEPEVLFTPDEITLNGRPIKYGESVKPDVYRIMMRKKGYDAYADRITIEPKNGAYVLKQILSSSPRRVVLNVRAEFPANLLLYPDVCTLNNRDVVGEESFKPGAYELKINRNGYVGVVKNVNIPPDDKPYEIQETLKPKPVLLDINITQDIPHDKKVEPVLTLINEKTNEAIKIKKGDKVLPESYQLKVEMDGYETLVSKEMIMPSETPYKIDKKLLSSLRNVVTLIKSEYPEGEVIVPDEITLDNKPLAKDFKVKPGLHELVILKDGYIPIRKPITIGANSLDFLLTETLETKTRLVTFKFRDSFDRRDLSPEEVRIADQRLASASETLNLKPGEYNLKAKLKGYNSLDENVLIPVGSTGLSIEKLMVAIFRDVIPEITSDFTGGPIEPDILTLGEMPVGKRTAFKPSVYQLVIDKEGYFPILETININPDPNPYLLKFTLRSKPRQLKLAIKSSFNDAKINPEQVIIGTQPVKDGQDLKPGTYPVLIKLKGYKQFTDNVTIEPSSKSFVLERTLQALPVLVKYEIMGDYDDKPIVPDVITLADKIIDQKTTFIPGKYALKIEKIGFEPKNKDIVIEPTDQPYILKDTLITIPREIELSITGDFPVGERIEPDIVALNGKDVRDNIFKPGPYQLDIEYPGYVPLKESLVIAPGERAYTLERVLITKPRMLKEKITYDVAPREDVNPYTITLAPIDKPTDEKIVKEGDMIKPGSYVLKINKKAYEAFETKKHIWPAEAPFVLEQELIAKQVMLRINVMYDIDAPPTLDQYKASLIDKVTSIPRFIQDGRGIKPGSYYLDIQRPGYTFGPRVEIDIEPSEEPYTISRKLIAKSRPISFDMVDETKGVLVPAYQILVNNKPVSFKDTFQPGSEFEVVVKFKKFQTVRKISKIVPGEGPFVEKVPLKPLVPYEFNVRNNTEIIDGIKYEYQFYCDGNAVEDHLIEVEKGVGRIFYKLWATPEAKNLVVYAGYLFTSRAFDKLRLGIPSRLTNISIVRLIEHLETKSKGERGKREALDILESMLSRYTNQRMLKECAGTEIDQFIQYVESWKLDDPADRVRMKAIIDSLEKLKS
ncbi:MAG: tetratricopeptide repeat protein [Planctomycetes bacterium]|jgi:hypothetical protein|nr:tetratricopeptide repeat protein [Planctomycetota bacterium]HPY73919.1 tetratricopeptide repeat protein [Planctomycetota bacterium]HQA99542.1 tetratricopeptide repeat protein [Planctomycetota bacterium]